jgi:hypothetical protein
MAATRRLPARSDSNFPRAALMAEPVHCGNPECGALLDEPINMPLNER